MLQKAWFSIAVAAMALGCGDAAGVDGVDGVDGKNGVDGTPGKDGTSCSVTDNGDGTKTIACPDGTMVSVADGALLSPT